MMRIWMSIRGIVILREMPYAIHSCSSIASIRLIFFIQSLWAVIHICCDNNCTELLIIWLEMEEKFHVYSSANDGSLT